MPINNITIIYISIYYDPITTHSAAVFHLAPRLHHIVNDHIVIIA